MEEQALIRRLKAGDRQALETLIDRYTHYCGAVAARVLGPCPCWTVQRPRSGSGLTGTLATPSERRPQMIPLSRDTVLWIVHRARIDGERPNFRGQDLTGADLACMDLTDVDFRGANLTGACLTRANIAGANLHGTDLTHASLAQTDLHDVDLADALLTSASLEEAQYRPEQFLPTILQDWDGTLGEAITTAETLHTA